MAWLLSVVIRFALSRQREYLADAGSVELTKNPDAMISALRKIEGRGELEGATSAVMEMCVDNPRSGFADLFATHPSIDKRIAAMVKFAGGHDPGPIALPEPEQAERTRRAISRASGPIEQAGAPLRGAPAGHGRAPRRAPSHSCRRSRRSSSGATRRRPPTPGPWGPQRGASDRTRHKPRISRHLVVAAKASIRRHFAHNAGEKYLYRRCQPALACHTFCRT